MYAIFYDLPLQYCIFRFLVVLLHNFVKDKSGVGIIVDNSRAYTVMNGV